ncbi:DNA polymerase-3 subunit beta [Desulfohalotomaculum tongense]|uniref:DNA polymerase III subunit beta n=1 Tax=Desulforadius tongensis TaxID=1216062 RepID=UPI00195B4695|nr:DNA polymerase III subunit beta [Desulforadius tongensis]MBM7855831.1 DNA polymerase-3 subunit beta [Desulforadius tongensis]
MKINTTKDQLFHGVQMVQRAVSLKNPLPVLSGIMFKTENDTLKMTATDLEIGIECSVPVTTIEEGAVVIPARYIAEIVRKLPDVPIDLSSDASSNTVVIKYGASEAKLHGFNADDFPSFPTVEKEVSFEISAQILKEILKQVLFATGSDENRPVFTGVLFEISEKGLTVVATDTHRLALKRINLSEDLPGTKVIIPGRTLGELVRVMAANEEAVKITLGGNQALFTLKDTVLVSRLIEGQFPAYDQVIPRSYKSRLRVKVKDLLESTERAALVTRSGNQTVKLDVQQELLLVTANTEIGGIHEEVNCYLEGDAMQIAFNAHYLTDVLRSIMAEEIYFELNGPLSPGVIKPVAKDDYLSLILPVRTA